MRSVFKKTTLLLIVLSIGLFGCTNREDRSVVANKNSNQFYSKSGQEFKVQFQALHQSSATSLDQLTSELVNYEIKQTIRFLAGPLTVRNIAGIQRNESILPALDKAYVKNNHVLVPYTYSGVWLIQHEAIAAGYLKIPVPYSVNDLKSTNWQKCTDTSSEEHSTWSFFWYFWDPSRPGCDHKEGTQYQEVNIVLGAETKSTTKSYPEYKNLIHIKNGVPTLAMTFAFGYVEDANEPNPYKDSDPGMSEFRRFHGVVQKKMAALGFKEKDILQSDMTVGATKIGTTFFGLKDGVQVEVSVVAAAGVDQMDIFATSYAKNHDGFFAWFGHSRVGSGFDAEQFKDRLRYSPDKFSVTSDYQLIYWSGCNSYAYYTLPFFKLKADLNPAADPNGTKNLDIISDGLPTYFSFNSFNAQVLLKALLSWQNPTSYQSIVNDLENYASGSGSTVLVNVLGDEDNQIINFK